MIRINSKQAAQLTVTLLALSVAFAPLRAAETMLAPSSAKVAAPLNYLTPGQPDPKTLLAPPPLPGSAEQFADMETVHAVYHYASDADKLQAYAEKEFSIFNFAPAVGAFFVETNLPQTAAFFTKVFDDADTITGVGKNFFQRPRPFTTDTNLSNGKLEKSFSYPSGHSTESMTIALVLAELLPEKRDAILAHARTIGWHRVQIARHYPTDIYAGRVLAIAIVAELKKNESFQKEFAAAQAEIKAAQAAARN